MWVHMQARVGDMEHTLETHVFVEARAQTCSSTHLHISRHTGKNTLQYIHANTHTDMLGGRVDTHVATHSEMCSYKPVCMSRRRAQVHSCGMAHRDVLRTHRDSCGHARLASGTRTDALSMYEHTRDTQACSGSRTVWRPPPHWSRLYPQCPALNTFRFVSTNIYWAPCVYTGLWGSSGG